MVIDVLSLGVLSPTLIFPEIQRVFKEGGERLSQGNYLEAERYFREAYEIAKKEGDKRKEAFSLVSIGVSLIAQQRFDEALFELDGALKLYPRKAEIILLKGLTLIALGRVEEAISDFEQASKSRLKKEIKGWFYVLKGMAFLRAGKEEEAHPQFERALKIGEEILTYKPKDTSCWYIRSLSLLFLNRFWEALRSFEWAYNLSKTLSDKINIYSLLGFNVLSGVFNALDTSDLEALEAWTAQWGYIYNQAQREDLASTLENVLTSVKRGLPAEEIERLSQIEEKLRQMEDPEFRLEALKEAITRKWPKGLSVVEAIRKERGKT